MQSIVRCAAFWMILIIASGMVLPMSAQGRFFSYAKFLTGPPSTLELFDVTVNATTGEVSINGMDSQAPSDPFTWIWGDGTIEEGWFPGVHTFADMTRNYHVRVIANYVGGGHDTAETIVRFVPPAITPVALPPATAAYVPSSMITLGTHLYAPPTGLVPFDDSYFQLIPRATVEYILSAAAAVEMEFTNNDVYRYNGKFEQYLFRDPSAGGAYSLWFTDPVSFGAGNGYISQTIGYSSLFHEMGHNFTLNTPSTYYYGGRIDGQANAIFSETMAQIYQHAAGYELVNRYLDYGLSEELMVEIRQDVVKTFNVLRGFYEEYVSAGKPYASWNIEATPQDETIGTFMTLAYKFCEHAEQQDLGYARPLKRMMTLLQLFDVDMASQYAQGSNTPEASTYRSTLMVAAISFAFQTDLRAEFRALNFPIDDDIYIELYDSPVPVELMSFDARAGKSSVILCWKTATEVNNYGFEIERRNISTDPAPASWMKIGFLEGKGATNAPMDYRFVDRTPGIGRCAYRLKQLDRNGAFTYSAAVEVDVSLTPGDQHCLSQNYPNPFNPVTEISFVVHDALPATLTVYDMLGREVAVLFDARTQADVPYRFAFDASRIPSGVYYYRLQTPGLTEVKKMTVTK
ncbi:MAG TPA: T9SS type A sorting domain-containing protein [Bacteroidota bacterium]|nr:T9SS type A sorting domain-containing protein [Bacteroidota bacterium]